VLQEQPYFIEVVLGSVGGTATGYSGFVEPVRMLF
jgi:hypothetical protein